MADPATCSVVWSCSRIGTGGADLLPGAERSERVHSGQPGLLSVPRGLPLVGVFEVGVALQAVLVEAQEAAGFLVADAAFAQRRLDVAAGTRPAESRPGTGRSRALRARYRP